MRGMRELASLSQGTSETKRPFSDTTPLRKFLQASMLSSEGDKEQVDDKNVSVSSFVV